MPQSLFNAWYETPYIDDKSWVINYHRRNNPAKSKILGFIKPDGSYDFSLADDIHAAAPATEIVFRPYATNENDEWETTTPKQWIANRKARLQGRPYRVTFGCEPSPDAAKLPLYLAFSRVLMEEADTQGVKLDMWAFQNQYFKMFTDDPRDISKGMWDECLRVAGFLRGTVQIDYHTYTGLWLPAGAYDDDYLRKVASSPEYLADPSTWFTWQQITGERRYQTRHLFRNRWLNYRALEKGYQEHDYFYGEGTWDFYGEEHDLVQTWDNANAIAGSDLDVCPPNARRVSGLRTLPNFFKWKRPDWTFLEATVHQLTWYGELNAHDPRFKGWTLYAYTNKGGDQQPYNVALYKDILEAMIGRNPVRSATQPPPRPPVVDLPPTVPPATEWRSQLTDKQRHILSRAKAGELTAIEETILKMADLLDEYEGRGD